MARGRLGAWYDRTILSQIHAARRALRAAGFDASGLAATKLELPWLVSPGLVGVARAT